MAGVAPHRRGFPDPGRERALHLPGGDDQHRDLRLLRHRRGRWRGKCAGPVFPTHGGATAVRLCPRYPRDFLGVPVPAGSRTESHVRRARHRHSLRRGLRQGLCRNSTGGRPHAAQRSAGPHWAVEPVLLRRSSRHLQRRQALHLVPARVRPAVLRHPRVHWPADPWVPSGDGLPRRAVQPDSGHALRFLPADRVAAPVGQAEASAGVCGCLLRPCIDGDQPEMGQYHPVPRPRYSALADAP